MSNLVISVKNQRKFRQRGRPKKDEILEHLYFLSCDIEFNPIIIVREQELMGRFILAINDTLIDSGVILSYYLSLPL